MREIVHGETGALPAARNEQRAIILDAQTAHRFRHNADGLDRIIEHGGVPDRDFAALIASVAESYRAIADEFDRGVPLTPKLTGGDKRLLHALEDELDIEADEEAATGFSVRVPDVRPEDGYPLDDPKHASVRDAGWHKL